MNKRNQGGHGSAYIFDGAVNVALFGPKGGSVRTQAISVEAAESLIADLQKAVQEAKGEPVNEIAADELAAAARDRGAERYLAKRFTCSCFGQWRAADIDESTWQQWRCPACGAWNNRESNR